MQIVRIPKGQSGTTMAHLTMSRASSSTVLSVLTIKGEMSSHSERSEYADVEKAEAAAVSTAIQRRASVLIIEDRT